ncbi:hypothetical protein EPUS_08749 [Endocarpon pusillum Z07020]|uniref:Oxidoreductase acuF-like C2H2 type zinc-finger domain-containing protein n=1 Tax=Endocarpon pusillum (strain Z07020 / HMAS-L-300199) TaxID=1263415 RepID=U1GKA6_ENDPU|nr:uncharacterized protein EPUS_08749 [Endocarpon pusillum Z07020]ERF72613.1 hypothetical protein EPUS_08749 [Endocarpon pusillum Z07020]
MAGVKINEEMAMVVFVAGLKQNFSKEAYAELHRQKEEVDMETLRQTLVQYATFEKTQGQTNKEKQVYPAEADRGYSQERGLSRGGFGRGGYRRVRVIPAHIYTGAICQKCQGQHRTENCWQQGQGPKDDKGGAGRAAQSVHSTILAGAVSYAEWLLDSGASCHMAKERPQGLSWEGQERVITAAGHTLATYGLGQMKIGPLSLKNVRWVPGLDRSLGLCKGKEILRVEKKNGVYPLSENMKMSMTAAVQENSNRAAEVSAEEAAPASLPTKEVSAQEEAAPVSALKKAPQRGAGGKWLQESLLHKRMGHLNRDSQPNLYSLRIEAGIEVATGARLPFEKLPKPEDSDTPNKASEEEEEEEEPPTELGLHMTMITEILGDLYKLSFRIRNSATRLRSLKPSLYKEVDEETGVDKFATYADFDKRHVNESVIQLRKEAAERMDMDPSRAAKSLGEDTFIIDRLATTLTERRKILRYWQRHAKKLKTGPIQTSSAAGPNDKGQTLDTQGLIEGSQRVKITPAPSVTAKTILSETIATEYDRKLDNMLDTRSAMSYASTSYDVQENAVELPSPPTIASEQTEFLCPYCSIVYPSRHAKPRAWRAHVLQDLQPYVCTYPDCRDGLQLYNTRHAWLEHERLVHRRVWQCFKHKTVVFRSKFDLRRHLESQHNDDVTEAQVQDLLDVSESSLADAREKCPICLIDRQFIEPLDEHMSSHLEKLATFSASRGIPTSDEEDSSGADDLSGKAQGLRSVYSAFSGILDFESPAESTAGPVDNEIPSKAPSLSDDKEPMLSLEHPDTLAGIARLASTYRNQGEWKEAEELEIQVLGMRMRMLGKENPDTLTSMTNLAVIYKAQGRWKEAEELQMQVLDTRKRVLEKEHPDTLTSMTHLALI